MKKSNIILFNGGCYGHFFEWIFNYLEGITTTLPFNSNGNSHRFLGNFFHPPIKLFEYINSDNHYRFSRCHPHIFEKVNEHESPFQKNDYSEIIQKDLDFLEKHFDKILVLSYNENSILWFENNSLDKVFLSEDEYNLYYLKHGYSKEFLQDIMTSDTIQRYRYIIDKQVNSKSSGFKRENLLGWNKTSIHDFDIWELRELLSIYHFSSNNGQISAWKTVSAKNPSIKFIFIDSLKTDFINTIVSAAKYFDIFVTDSQIDKLKEIHIEWAKIQKQMDKDLLCAQIVNSIITNEFFDWFDYSLSIIDEAWIQKSLNDNGIKIKCCNLNKFPTNTTDFLPLLERT